MPALPATLRPSRVKWVAILAVALAFTATGIAMTRDAASNGPWAWFTVGVFTLFAVVAFVNLLPGASYLRLDRDGFEMRALYRRHRIGWDDVAGFGLMRVPPTGKQRVGWNYRPGRGQPSRLRGFNLDRFGYEAALPDTYGLSAADLVALLESLRQARAAG